MSIWDGSHELPNIPFATLGGEVLWEDLLQQGEYRLQRNRITGHCRILDRNSFRVAWGQEGAMRARLQTLSPRSQTAPGHPEYGDVIGVHRMGGLYDHYGVYESDNCVYEYAAEDQDFGDVAVRTTTFPKFVGESGAYFILTFPEEYGAPGKWESGGAAEGANLPAEADAILRSTFAPAKFPSYRLYSPEETIQRARSRLGEHAYDLMLNNCEHFAIWCKTGLHESYQVTAFLRAVQALARVWHALERQRAAASGDPPAAETPGSPPENTAPSAENPCL